MLLLVGVKRVECAASWLSSLEVDSAHHVVQLIAEWFAGVRVVLHERFYAGNLQLNVCILLTGTPFHPSQPCFFGSEGTDINKETELLRT